ncbi:MAG: PIG-L family deacetylase [Deltaproteobacteria bacterium]|nr:PIG-L family deacetylase [Deltaproteobacteria bacterium]
MTRVLVIAPHMDDEVLGCGGAIARHVDEGDKVDVCVVCNRAYCRIYDPDAIATEEASTGKAKEILGYSGLHFLNLPDERLYGHLQELLEALERIVAEVKPEVVYTCHAGDLHQDHRTVAHAANIALRAVAAPFVRRVLAYEVPSGTEQAFPGASETFRPNVFTDIEAQLDRKLAAVEVYERESRPFPHPRSQEMLRAKARVRGAQCGRAAAEAFVLLRETL